MARIAVVGHVEWVDFLRVRQLPSLGQIEPAQRLRANAAGGAVVAAVAIAELGAEVHFFGAIGDDALGKRASEELQQHGITTHMAIRDAPTRQAITLFEPTNERSIITIGERLQPSGDDDLAWDLLDETDGVYFTAGDLGALHHARRARTLVLTPRISEQLHAVDVALDALVYSADDAAERAWAAPLRARARYVVETDGGHGGHFTGEATGSWQAAVPPGPVRDTYGAGDSFAGAFTYGLASTNDPARAAEFGAAAAARMLTRIGAP